MTLGSTYEEKKTNMELLRGRAKKWGKFFGAIGVVMVVLMLFFALAAVKGFFAKLWVILCALICPPALYLLGFLWYIGFFTVKSWFVKLGLGITDTASAAVDTVDMSYLLGGKRAAQTSLIMMLVVICITLMFGFWIGVFNYSKWRKELASADR